MVTANRSRNNGQPKCSDKISTCFWTKSVVSRGFRNWVANMRLFELPTMTKEANSVYINQTNIFIHQIKQFLLRGKCYARDDRCDDSSLSVGSR